LLGLGCLLRAVKDPLTPTLTGARRLEPLFLVYTAEKNRGLNLRLHFLLVAAWAVGSLKTVSQIAHAYSDDLSSGMLLPKYAFVLLMQLGNVAYQFYSMRRLALVERWVVWQEK
jgi:hypothetical protein